MEGFVEPSSMVKFELGSEMLRDPETKVVDPELQMIVESRMTEDIYQEVYKKRRGEPTQVHREVALDME